MSSPKEPTGTLTRILATLDVLWLLGVVVYGVLQVADVVPAISVGAYVAAVVLGVGGAAVLFGSGR